MFTRLKPSARRIHFAVWVAFGFWFLPLLNGVAQVSPDSSGSEEFLVRNWDLDEGLPSTCINAMIRTGDGYLWLATQHGLVRFDGIRFQTFTTENTPALKDNRITCLTIDRPNTFCLRTRANVLRYDHGVFTSLGLENVTRDRNVYAMAADAGGNLWLAVSGVGLIRFKDGRTEIFTNDLPSLNFLQLLAAPDGRLWYVSANGQLGCLAAGKCHAASASLDFVYTIALARDGGLWLTAKENTDADIQIYKYKDDKIAEELPPIPSSHSLGKSRPNALLEDSSGNVWCGTAADGVFFKPADGPWQRLLADRNFSKVETLCLMDDAGQSVWIGSRTSGLHQVVPQPLSAYFLPTDIDQNKLLTVCIRRDGSIWGGTDGAGIFRWHDDATNRLAEPQGLGGLRINSLLEDSRSNFWASTGAGLFQLREGQFELVEKPVGRASVSALYEDSQGTLWAGTRGGLVCISDPEHKKFGPDSGLPVGPILDITKDATGRFWVAVQGKGVFYQTENCFTNWSPADGSDFAREKWNGGRNVCRLLPDKDSSIWVATYGDGLFRLQGNHFCIWSWEKDGLPSNHIFALLNDDSGNLWLSSENGIFGYARQALLDYQSGKSLPVPRRLTQADGLPFKVCSGGSQPVAARFPDGRICFPDDSALVVFDPARWMHPPQAWPPAIEQIRADGTIYSITSTQPVRMISGVRSLEINFTSPDMMSPNRLRFRYRLEGLDKEWIEAGSRRSAQYSRLPPGNYTFRVAACDAYGRWSKNDASLRLTIVPRFWETRWFQLGAGIFLVGAASLTAWQIERARSRRKLAALEKQRAVLEHERALERERARIARDIHDDLGASLTEVALLGDMAGSKTENPEEIRAKTRQISAAAREMSQSLEAIVWAVRPQNDTLRSLVKYMSRRTDELFEKNPRHYQFHAPDELPECSVHAEVRHNVFLAYKEALTNSLKHAQASLVQITVTCDRGMLRITVADNGWGFDPQDVRSEGTGLKNMRQRMEEIGGGFELESRPGYGTTARLHFSLQPRNQESNHLA